MLEHGLHGWTFGFDRARRRFGLCDYGARRISLSKHLTALNSEAQVRDTLLHEIAHALTPGAGHGARWQDACLRLGATPRRLCGVEVKQPPAKYLLVCTHCGLELSRERKTRRPLACRRCCDAHHGGRYSRRYALRWRAAPSPGAEGSPEEPAS